MEYTVMMGMIDSAMKIIARRDIKNVYICLLKYNGRVTNQKKENNETIILHINWWWLETEERPAVMVLRAI